MLNLSELFVFIQYLPVNTVFQLFTKVKTEVMKIKLNQNTFCRKVIKLVVFEFSDLKTNLKSQYSALDTNKDVQTIM